MSDRVKISVIIPIYNTESFLRKCLDSVLSQTLEEVEIICVNDASSDLSLSILKEYQQSSPCLIHIIDLNVNMGVGGARNRGIEKAQGEYIAFLDSDDFVDFRMYEKLYNCAKNDEADIVDCDYYEYHSHSEIFQKTSNTDDQIGILNKKLIKSLIVSPGLTWTKIFKKELFTKFRFLENIAYEDTILSTLYLNSNKLSKVHEPLYYYRIQPNSVSHSGKYFFDRLNSSELMLKEFKRHNKYIQFKEEIQWKFIQLYYINTILLILRSITSISEALEKGKFLNKNMKFLSPAYRSNIYFKKAPIFHKFITLAVDLLGLGTVIIIFVYPYRILRDIKRRLPSYIL